MKRIALLFICFFAALFLLYFTKDIWGAIYASKAIKEQANAALNYTATLGEVKLQSGPGILRLYSISLVQNGDPQQKQVFSAEEIILHIDVVSAIKREFRIYRGDVYNANILLEYVAPNASNLKIAENHFRDYLRERKVQSPYQKIEWNVYGLTFYRIRFRVVDYDGTLLADVIIPQITISTLGSHNTGGENAASVFRNIQLAMFKEILKDNVEGEYDLPGLLKVAGREIKHLEILSTDGLNNIRQTSKELLKRLLK